MTEDGHAEQRTDDDGEAVDPLLKAIGKQIKLLRDRAGLTQAELGRRIGYSMDLVASVERGRRPPKPPFIDGAERELDAGGLLKAIEGDVERARLPARFRDFALLEKDAVSLYSYEPLTIPGLLQTADYTRSLMSNHCPPLSDELIEDRAAARLERQKTFSDNPTVVMGFVIEEAALRRPVGGPGVMKEQLHQLLDRAALRNVSIQVMPTASWQHNGSIGPLTLLQTADGRDFAYTEAQGVSNFITDRSAVQVCCQRHGIIRMQALGTEESAQLIKQLAGEL
ncbi:helix-turn-helix protein [Streptomyces sp. Amel2xB2]|uniref:helix-turn-helix domain-containing protein n=1 Tax=Streptomyces sp. Amel2xB2 TaxID=1305829 RepID=UPI000DBFFEFB|nr:helix-turn-helix transcriptional regulator [Streptomyces sp. Amel2xB2]RAJ58933.1 helix-turn-helix protein [Streptomyces sp. Amel2xB2]